MPTNNVYTSIEIAGADLVFQPIALLGIPEDRDRSFR